LGNGNKNPPKTYGGLKKTAGAHEKKVSEQPAFKKAGVLSFIILLQTG
jgi:hypothetical protein